MNDNDFDNSTDWQPPPHAETERLVLHMDGFEGPLDLLLSLAREQKVDLAALSILELVEQYIAFIRDAERLKLEVAADYLVMACWLLYLKSRLLLPKEDDAQEPTADELAMRLQLRLQRLDAMRECGAQLMGRDRLGRDVFARGAPETVVTSRRRIFATDLYALLHAYGQVERRRQMTGITIRTRPVFALEDAIARLSDLIGAHHHWADLMSFLPAAIRDPALYRSAVASHFVASLELARRGVADIDQREVFGPLYVRKRG